MSTYTTRPLTLLVLLSIVASAGMTVVAAHDQAGLQAVAIARNGSQPSLSWTSAELHGRRARRPIVRREGAVALSPVRT